MYVLRTSFCVNVRTENLHTTSLCNCEFSKTRFRKRHALFNRVNGFFYPILHNFREISVTFGRIIYIHKTLLSDSDFRKNRRSEIHIHHRKYNCISNFKHALSNLGSIWHKGSESHVTDVNKMTFSLVP
jgi:hypothetical protein